MRQSRPFFVKLFTHFFIFLTRAVPKIETKIDHDSFLASISITYESFYSPLSILSQKAQKISLFGKGKKKKKETFSNLAMNLKYVFLLLKSIPGLFHLYLERSISNRTKN